MKQGINLEEFNTQLGRIERNRQDIISDDLTYGRGSISTPYNVYSLTPHSRNQLSDHYNIPRAAMNRYWKDPAYQQYWDNIVRNEIAAKPGPRLLRVIDGTLHGFVSTRFNVGYDAHRTFPTLLEALSTADMTIESSAITDTHTYFKALSKKLKGEVLDEKVQFGIAGSTSDYGLARHSMKLLMFTLTCLNGMVVSSVECTLSHTHRGKNMWVGDDGELDNTANPEEIKATMDQLGIDMIKMLNDENIDRIIGRINSTGPNKITGESKKLKKLIRKLGISKYEVDDVVSHLVASNNYTVWGLSSAITRAAQDVRSYDRSVEMEAIGWNVFGNPLRLVEDDD